MLEKLSGLVSFPIHFVSSLFSHLIHPPLLFLSLSACDGIVPRHPDAFYVWMLCQASGESSARLAVITLLGCIHFSATFVPTVAVVMRLYLENGKSTIVSILGIVRTALALSHRWIFNQLAERIASTFISNCIVIAII